MEIFFRNSVLRWLPLCFVLALATTAHAQTRQAEFEIHNRGQLWETMQDNGKIGAPSPTDRFEFFPSMDWPGGPLELPSKDVQRSYQAGAGLWIGGRHADGSLFFTENGPFAYVDEGTFQPIEKTNNFVGAPGYDPDKAEQVITAEFTTTEGMRVVRTSRAWSFRGINDFIIIEYTFTNQSGGALKDVYFGFPYLLRPSYQDFVVHNGWGDALNRADGLVRYDTSLTLLYAWDDTPSFDLPQDVGNFWEEAGELRTPGYAGFALLDAPPGAAGQPQPSTVFYAQLLGNQDRLTLGRTSAEQLYAILSGEDKSLQADPDERLTPFTLMACGPYSLAPSESIRIVLVEAVDGLPINKALEGLAAQSELPAGEDSLKHSIRRAKALYENGYRYENIPPPAPDLEVIPLPSTRNISLTWEPLENEWTDPITGAGNFERYRVYRSSRSFIGPFEMIQRVRTESDLDRRRFFDAERCVWKFIDNDVSLGVSYFYAVTSVDEQGHESWLTNRTTSPVTVTSSPAESALNVSVFPNPFRRVSGFPTQGEKNSIVWTNLPARATIRIYTSSGELVRTIEHDDPTSGQAVWDQLTESHLRTAPGIYFWTVESEVGTAQGTLLIVK